MHNFIDKIHKLALIDIKILQKIYYNLSVTYFTFDIILN